MINIPDKTDNTTQLSANEFNPFNRDIKNSVSSTGQTFDSAKEYQLAVAKAIYAAGGDFYTDGGAANSYVLNTLTNTPPGPTMRAPISYFSGFKARFIAGNTNTGASVVNVAAIGAKSIVLDANGSALSGGEIVEGDLVELLYIDNFDNTPGSFDKFIITKNVFNNIHQPAGGEENPIINSGMTFFQQAVDGASFVNDSGYAADRFISSSGGGTGECEINQGKFSPGTTLDNSDDPVYYLEHDQTVAATTGSRPAITYRMEGVHNYAGKTMTVSFGALTSSGTTNYQVYITQNFGTSGSTSVVTPGPAAALLTNSLERYEVTFNVPSISGKTVGPDKDDYLQIDVLFDFNATYTVKFTHFMTNLGQTANYFHAKLISKDLADCQRYCRKSYNIYEKLGEATQNGCFAARYINNGSGHGNPGINTINFPTMRDAPTVVFYNPTTGAEGTWRDDTNDVDKSISASKISDSSVQIAIASPTTVNFGAITGHYLLVSEL